MFLVLVVVFVKFPKECSGGGSESLEENFILEEEVDFLSLKYDVHPASQSFPKMSSDPDKRVSNR